MMISAGTHCPRNVANVTGHAAARGADALALRESDARNSAGAIAVRMVTRLLQEVFELFAHAGQAVSFCVLSRCGSHLLQQPSVRCKLADMACEAQMVVGIEAEPGLTLRDVCRESSRAANQRRHSEGLRFNAHASERLRPNRGDNAYVDLREEDIGRHPADEACIRAGKARAQALRVVGIAVACD